MIAAFGDIRGFGSYTQRISDPQTQIVPFMEKYDTTIEDFESAHSYFIKHLGDGFLCIAKIDQKDGRQIVAFLTELWGLLQKLLRLIHRTKYPRPDGFRIRVAAGHVYQSVRQDGQIDFRGYHVNLASKMLQIEKENCPFVVHESAKQLIGKSETIKAGLQFKLLPPPQLRRYPEGIYKEDMSALWSLTVRP